MTEVALSAESEGSRCQRMLEEVADLCWSWLESRTSECRFLLVQEASLIRGSFLGPPLFRAWFEGEDENADACCTMVDVLGC